MELTPLLALCVLLATVVAAEVGTMEAQSSYIVHVAAEHAPVLPFRGLLDTQAYTSFLRDLLPVDMFSPAPTVLYSYSSAATGFAAHLTERQAAHLASSPSVLAVVPDVMLALQTTLTPSFLGLSPSSGLLSASKGATDVVIGVIDSGVYPEGHASFAADPSLPPLPSKFRGSCVSGPSFNATALCNNKLVGAKVFDKGQRDGENSPIDVEGHGTHTASTAAGSTVADAAFFDYARGTAVGVAPGARIAVYKACTVERCANSDILAAFDEAIKDRVDVISLSLADDGMAPDFYNDLVAVGAFRAVSAGIVVSAAAANYGPGDSTAMNIAPWFLTVGASTLNREFPADVVLGNGETLTGTTLYAGEPLGATKIPLVYGRHVGSTMCKEGELNPTKVAGKIVLCESGVNSDSAKGRAVKLAGGAGAIISGPKQFGEQAITRSHVHPATAVSFVAAGKIYDYIRKQTSPTATIVFRGTVVGSTPPSPRMASFSGRGPNFRAPEIFKPDVTAPGVDILAAWTGAASPTELDSDTRRVKFNIISGTSMSCPHVSGIAAMLRQARPEWSPAAIKSALMTTAYNKDSAGETIGDMSTGKASTPFARGAGHVDPNRAMDPGLVYDAGREDYITFLCALGYTTKQVAMFAPSANCLMRVGSSVGDHNYPAFSVVFTSTRIVVTQRRIVRNVGSDATATYTAKVTAPDGVLVAVSPGTLQFSVAQQTLGYEVIFTRNIIGGVTEKHTFGSIEWSDGQHSVTSPIAITNI